MPTDSPSSAADNFSVNSILGDIWNSANNTFNKYIDYVYTKDSNKQLADTYSRMLADEAVKNRNYTAGGLPVAAPSSFDTKTLVWAAILGLGAFAAIKIVGRL